MEMLRCRHWNAWYDAMPAAGRDHLLHVAGSCELDSSSTELRLEPDNEGVVDDPELLVLRLEVVDEGRFGDTTAATRQVRGSWHEAGVKRVVVRLPEGDDDVTIDVLETG